jgi:integrase
MARAVNRLNARFVATVTRRGLYADGHGLHLQVSSTGGKSWVKRFTVRGKTRDMGLGPLRLISLAEARAANLAIDADRLKGAAVDPIEARRARRNAAKVSAVKTVTFADVAESHIAAQRAAWRGSTSEEQWRQSLRDYVYPVFGDLPIAAVDTALVLRVVEPLWRVHPETASRVLQRIAAVLDRAASRALRTGENPARWKGHLSNLLPKKTRVHRVTHFAAMPYREIGDFVAQLRQHPTAAARALEFAILTVARSSTVLGARWGEIDFSERLWSIPAERDKTGQEHRVPLSDPALALLARQRETATDGGFVFAVRTRSALRGLLRSLGCAATTHGFRSTFTDWAAECTSAPTEIREGALGHKVASAVERAYRRTDLLSKRRRLLEAWATYIATPSPRTGAEIVTIGAGR